ncbi:hypothetical protein BgiBS90_011642, partial [Biomphalaria glabrata]
MNVLLTKTDTFDASEMNLELRDLLVDNKMTNSLGVLEAGTRKSDEIKRAEECWKLAQGSLMKS